MTTTAAFIDRARSKVPSSAISRVTIVAGTSIRYISSVRAKDSFASFMEFLLSLFLPLSLRRAISLGWLQPRLREEEKEEEEVVEKEEEEDDDTKRS